MKDRARVKLKIPPNTILTQIVRRSLNYCFKTRMLKLRFKIFSMKTALKKVNAIGARKV